ncbi:hypothetical protein NQ176_g10449 [Zarea fungicola]|uniref:Uncharacterized protein n=1 Tax=Zarea fungicola TaxID=93591 RepID=A0ACC1MG63_9HYPO|nr:hypothetical protein NQ176_g10449 [Lecanicillium fungicola]
MMVVGGYTAMTGTGLACLEDGPIVLFNITSGQWMDGYSPERYGLYGVHEKVQTVIGGTATGNATVTAPVPSGWATPALGDVFSTPYDFGKMKTYWPYNSSVPTNTTDTPVASTKPRGVPSWVAPVLGVVLGLVLMTGSILLMCIWRRRLAARAGSDVSSSTDVMSERLYYFVKGHPQHKPSIGVVSSCEDSDIDRTISRNTVSPLAETSASPPLTIHEMDDNQITELPDTSSPVELNDTERTPTNTSATSLQSQRVAGFTPLQTSFNTFGSLRSSASQYSVGPSSGSGGTTPATPQYPSRRGTRLSTISAVSFNGSEDANGYCLNTIVSPIGPVSPPVEDGGGKSPDDYITAAGMSPLRNVVSKEDFLHETR